MLTFKDLESRLLNLDYKLVKRLGGYYVIYSHKGWTRGDYKKIGNNLEEVTEFYYKQKELQEIYK